MQQAKLYQDRKLLFVDTAGNYVSFCERLAKDWGKVYYYCPNYSGWPDLKKSMVGERLKDVKVIEQMWWKWNDYGTTEGDYVFNEIDDFVFADVYMGDVQMHLIHDLGKKNVWGSRKSEELELLRFETKEKLKEIGLPVTPTINFENFVALMEFLDEQNTPMFIKLSWFRGVMESGKFEGMVESVEMLAELNKQLKDCAADEGENAMELIAETPIESDIEIGVDTDSIDGESPNETMYGIEIKDKFYISTHCPFEKLPEQLQYTLFGLNKLINRYGKNGCRMDISTEIRIDEKGQGHLIDITMRFPSPPSEIKQEWITNISQKIKEGSEGKVVEPIFKTKYAAQIEIHSLYAKDNRVDFEIPDEIKDFVKLKNYCGVEKTGSQKYAVIPTGDLVEIANIVAYDDTIEGCIKKLHEYADKIKAENITIHWDAVDKAMEDIEKMHKAGIKF